MALINLVDKSKLRALEARCNSKELAEHVCSFLTLTTMQRLPGFANGHFLHTFEYCEHLPWDRFTVLLDECRPIPNAFLSFDLDEWETESMESMDSSESTESEAIGDTTNIRVQVVLERPWHPSELVVAWKVSPSGWNCECTEPLYDPMNRNMTKCLEDTRIEVSRARRVPCMVEMPTTPAQWLNFIRLWVFGPPQTRPLKQTELQDYFMATYRSGCVQ